MRLVGRTLSATMLSAAMLWVSCASHRNPEAPLVTPAGVRFTLVDRNAKTVAVAGSFNQWSTNAHPMARGQTGGVWSVVVPLPSGEHRFSFVLDGDRWVVPPMADAYVDDGFGSRDGVVFVKRREP
jgi:1,4-alpha-glucan branching enzyme